MAESALELIRQGYLLANILAPDDTLSGSDAAFGLDVLNELLDSYAGTALYIPYRSTVTITLSGGQADYTLGPSGQDVTTNKFVYLEGCFIDHLKVNYPVYVVKPQQYRYSYRSSDWQGLPDYVVHQNEAAFTKLTFYPEPDQSYSCNVVGKQVLSALDLHQPMSEIPAFYQRFLKYELGRELSNYYPAASWDQKMELMRGELVSQMQAASDTDLTLIDEEQRTLTGAAQVERGF